jgi:hypothetical protein
VSSFSCRSHRLTSATRQPPRTQPHRLGTVLLGPGQSSTPSGLLHLGSHPVAPCHQDAALRPSWSISVGQQSTTGGQETADDDLLHQ